MGLNVAFFSPSICFSNREKNKWRSGERGRGRGLLERMKANVEYVEASKLSQTPKPVEKEKPRERGTCETSRKPLTTLNRVWWIDWSNLELC